MSYQNACPHRLCSRQSMTISQHCLCMSPLDLYERNGFTDFIWTAKTHFDLCLRYNNQTMMIGPTHLHSLDDINTLHTVRYVYHPTPTTKMTYHRASGSTYHRYLANIVDDGQSGWIGNENPPQRQPFNIRRVIHFPLSLRSCSCSCTPVFTNPPSPKHLS